jgi:hypothetical protein
VGKLDLTGFEQSDGVGGVEGKLCLCSDKPHRASDFVGFFGMTLHAPHEVHEI